MIMLLIMHVSVALSSLVMASIVMFNPTKSRLYMTYGLEAAVLVSGTSLVVLSDTNLLQSCVTGLLYLMAISSATILGKYKLQLQETKN